MPVYSDKNAVRQLTGLLLAHGIDHVVVAPGSRNAPLVQTFAAHPGFRCFCVTDERSAAFFALGMILRRQEPVAVCCTSGTALLNLGPAVAEAFYRELPLLVLSADRPAAWVGQMDGQTMPQPGIFGALAKCAVNLPEGDTSEDRWHANQLINKTLLALAPWKTARGFPGGGPAQINIPLREPLFSFTDDAPEAARAIRLAAAPPRLDELPAALADIWRSSRKRLILAGQLLPARACRDFTALEETVAAGDAVVVVEHLANLRGEGVIRNPDAALAALDEDEARKLAPDLLVTFGGHLVSKRMKQLLRAHRPAHHWHISPDRSAPDLFQALTEVIETVPERFFPLLAHGHEAETEAYARRWREASHKACAATEKIMESAPFTDMLALQLFLARLPRGAALHLANSSTARNAQLFPLPGGVDVHCNRGMNGIDGSLSTAVGFAAVADEPVFVVIGDLSFFYDINALWNGHIGKNLRILLLNNGGGGIFHTLPGLGTASRLDMIAGHHDTSAGALAASFGLVYATASTREAFEARLPWFTTEPDGPLLFEVKFPLDACAAFHAQFHQRLKDGR
ncbi:MAG: 2-succinyl-5-enolpyruvyl-6-hydroxy-3-cyclohexene-1-carboxylic-acid synthase [Zoogloeaceae bacterium]|jgi:2-succinyl-5-enolpyruvyl-6-hydroxy-3-cyclohexene-1-carboxylate synthase|nr:2-succinyl-5-enolpyruvyl-6-hydroxy-3-cyclohexene-1-carboxylic-acid synthase [Zoogloeaceae bacterium]